MRLLYITNQIFAAAGLERVLSIKASALVEDYDYEVHIITLNQGEKDLFYPFSNKIKLHDLKIKGKNILYISSYIRSIRTAVKRINPDCISVCDDGIKGFYLPLVLFKKYPVIYERHASKHISVNKTGWKQKLKFYFQNKIMHFGARQFNSFIVLTANNLKEWNLTNLKVIPNPLSLTPKEVSSLNQKKVIAVGSHYHQKGFDILLNIWSKIIHSFPDWELDIFGKIDKNQTYLKLAKKLNIHHKVNFYAPVKDIGSKYKNASIYTMTSRSEGFGMVLIEAMAYGLPCISFDCPSGPRDIITNSKDGYLIENGNEDAFVEKLKFLMSNKTARIKMGENAQIKSKNYLPEQIIGQWHSLFCSLRRKPNTK
ncbi:glycosyltransferase family 4 protein [Flavivirga aquimarina]|uniref:Glycosyltransferase family 4 protein n=1 Tax=Flavivirga aquimarina TaxID=2027862 RepID=A0ABT8WDM0_9FLAO|nr:glycosyltransferase family 4 protein [Flavivirga aquimarina]MDO5971127.1 glycosyltransferase family 4 protein [Flavivirga aquimarina]